MPQAQAKQYNRAMQHKMSYESSFWLDILEQMPIAVSVVEIPSGRVVWHNNKAEDILENSLIPNVGMENPTRYIAVHDDGRSYQAQEYPLARAIQHEEVIANEPLRLVRGDERPVVLEVSASRVSVQDLGQVVVCTYQDVTEKYAARHLLKEESERVQLAAEAGAIVGTWIWDVPHNRVTADERFAHTFSLDPDRCRTGLPSEETLEFVHPDDRPGLEAAVATALARGGACRHQYRVLLQDGLYRWLEASGRVELDENGAPVRFPGVLMDISACKNADEARSLLMREVDHRALNALAMVQSVVRLTDATAPGPYQEAVIGRIDAMARGQILLARNNWERSSVEEIVLDELASHPSPEQFKVYGPKLVVTAEQVEPLSMILHEMTSNARKHGALSAAVGELEISWEGGVSGMSLTWVERGGPAVSQPPKSRYGLRLISKLAAQLGGAMNLDWRTTGLTATLSWRGR